MRTPERIILTILISFAVACNLADQAQVWELETQPTSASASEQAEREVRQVHEAYLRTLIEEGSDAALVKYYGDDFTYVGVDGQMIDKAGLRARMQRNALQTYELEDDLRRLSVYGEVAIVSGHSLTRGTEPGEGVARHRGLH